MPHDDANLVGSESEGPVTGPAGPPTAAYLRTGTIHADTGPGGVGDVPPLSNLTGHRAPTAGPAAAGNVGLVESPPGDTSFALGGAAAVDGIESTAAVGPGPAGRGWDSHVVHREAGTEVHGHDRIAVHKSGAGDVAHAGRDGGAGSEASGEVDGESTVSAAQGSRQDPGMSPERVDPTGADWEAHGTHEDIPTAARPDAAHHPWRVDVGNCEEPTDAERSADARTAGPRDGPNHPTAGSRAGQARVSTDADLGHGDGAAVEVAPPQSPAETGVAGGDVPPLRHDVVDAGVEAGPTDHDVGEVGDGTLHVHVDYIGGGGGDADVVTKEEPAADRHAEDAPLDGDEHVTAGAAGDRPSQGAHGEAPDADIGEGPGHGGRVPTGDGHLDAAATGGPLQADAEPVFDQEDVYPDRVTAEVVGLRHLVPVVVGGISAVDGGANGTVGVQAAVAAVGGPAVGAAPAVPERAAMEEAASLPAWNLVYGADPRPAAPMADAEGLSTPEVMDEARGGGAGPDDEVAEVVTAAAVAAEGDVAQDEVESAAPSDEVHTGPVEGPAVGAASVAAVAGEEEGDRPAINAPPKDPEGAGAAPGDVSPEPKEAPVVSVPPELYGVRAERGPAVAGGGDDPVSVYAGPAGETLGGTESYAV